MSRRTTWNALVAFVAVAALALHTRQASATAVTSGVNLPSGSFSTTISGGGTANLTGASGNYRNWVSLGFLGWQSVNTGISAANQTVGVTMGNINILNAPASGSANITFDDLTPPTPIALNSLSADLNGAGGANQNYNFNISVAPLTVNIGGLGNASLALSVAGQITDATFTSTNSSLANPSYFIDGNLSLTMQGNVTGVLTFLGIPINLGTVYTLAPSAFNVATTLPGNMVLTDLSGGLGPFPSDMQVDLGAALPFSIPVPLTLPFSTVYTSTAPNTKGVNGFTALTINAGSQINANLMLGNPSYSLTGVLPQVLVPEPGTLAMGLMALVALSMVGSRFRKST